MAAARAQRAATSPSNEMKVRRLTDAPQAGLAYHVEGGSVHHSKFGAGPCDVRFTPESRHGYSTVVMSALCRRTAVRTPEHCESAFCSLQFRFTFNVICR